MSWPLDAIDRDDEAAIGPIAESGAEARTAINLVEVAKENWSIGGGVAQYAT